MKRKLSVLLVIITVCGMTLTAQAEVDNEETSVYYSSLPETFSYDVSMEQIGADIDQYILKHDMGIERNTNAYTDLMHEFCFSDFPDLTDTTKRFYQAYASVYLSNIIDISADISTYNVVADQTIGEIREENQEASNKIIEAAEQVQPNQVQPRFSSYDLGAAREYAKAYADESNLQYIEYSKDCTNFASQILNAGGMKQNDRWKYSPLSGTGVGSPFRTWVNAHAFTEYWSLEKGYLGPACTSLSQVKSSADVGDFLSWMNHDTLEFYHIQFVQTKTADREIYCSQHTPNYYNKKLSSKVSDSDFANQEVVVINFY